MWDTLEFRGPTLQEILVYQQDTRVIKRMASTCINQQAQLTLSMTVLLTTTPTACRDRVAHHYISQVDMPLA